MIQRLAIPEEELQSEWEAQAQVQTKPAPRMYAFLFTIFCLLTSLWHVGRSKTKGKQAVQAVLELAWTIELQKKAITKLETTLAQTSVLDIADLTEELQSARDHLTCLEQGFNRKKAALGVSEQADLRKLQRDAFLQIRMNALVLKHHLRDH